MNLLHFYDNVFNIYETKDIIHLDFQKALDKVPHKPVVPKVGGIAPLGAVERSGGAVRQKMTVGRRQGGIRSS